MRGLLIAIALSLAVSQPLFARPTVVSKDKYLVGGLVGSIAGFGIGHAIQDRYSNLGWVFTVSDTVTMLGWKVIPWIIQAAQGESHKATFDLVSNISATAFFGFRLWQIADLWIGAQPERPLTAEMMLEKPWQNGWWGAQKQTDMNGTMVSLFKW